MASDTDFTQRNAAIDILRALTMFVMIFVNDFWKVHDIPWWLDHARRGEDFMGLADVVFPCFLFVVGMSVPFAIERRYAKGLSGESTVGHILSRTLALLVMGAFITNSEARLSPDVSYRTGIYWFLMVGGFFLYLESISAGERCVSQAVLCGLKGNGSRYSPLPGGNFPQSGGRSLRRPLGYTWLHWLDVFSVRPYLRIYPRPAEVPDSCLDRVRPDLCARLADERILG
ncbi:MAG: heparan-alpha-glucosaminide N-acetyltransferase domain-containing protein [Tannerellaceae bacterium]|jgi:hypothetical protein|nr:heparan-alpha-glucosaminide N-acetyltransferase domain-containing protein [Tannerellaceae bacterium]